MRNQAFLLLWMWATVSPAQTTDPVFIKGNFDFGAFDPMDNLYLVSGSGLKKITFDGTPEYNYSNSLQGTITSIDVINPLKILVFYKDANRVVFLNQQLAPMNDPVSIADDNSLLAQVVCNDQQNGFWFFDSNTQMLCRMNQQRNIDLKSMNLSQKLAGAVPMGLAYCNTQLFLWTDSGDLLVFDHYGNYLKSRKLDVSDNFIANADYYYYASGLRWMRFDFNRDEPNILIKDMKLDYSKIFGNQHYLVLIADQGVYLFKNYFDAN
jgi:hypothetical protein